MQAQLVFAFPVDVSAADAIHAVANHFAIGVSIAGAPANVPAHIKTVVENYAAGVEPSAAVAFGGLLNGEAGNVQATPANAQFFAGVATSTTVPEVSQDTSATTPPASSAPALPPASAAPAHVASATTTNLANNVVEFDSTGLPWDERIHSGNKTKSPSGEWRTKKAVDRGLVASVTAELRAAVGNANVTHAPVSVDPTVKRQQAIEFAHNVAIAVCGASPISDSVLQELLNGKPATLSPHQADWYNAYFAKRNAAFVEYMQRPTVATDTPVATAVSPTPGATTVAPVTVAPQGVELDAAGLPHDTRINVDAKLKDAAGVWLQRHDVPGETKLMVMAELRAALAGNGAAPASNGETAPASTPVVPTPPVAPVITAADAATSFVNLMGWVVANQLAGRISTTAAPEAAKQLGFDGIAAMAGETGKPFYPYIVQLLQGQGAV